MSASPSMDHIGIGVPDLVAAKQFYDGFMPVVGFAQWFPADEHQFNYGPVGTPGTQLFFYRATEADGYSRHGVGLQHLAFAVPDRSTVEEAFRGPPSGTARWFTRHGSSRSTGRARTPPIFSIATAS